MHAILTNINNAGTFLKDFLVNRFIYLKKCFLDIIWTVMLSAGSNFQTHTDVLPVANGLKHCLKTERVSYIITHTHTCIYIYIYPFVCVYVHVCVYNRI